MRKQNHFNAFRQHMIDTFELGRNSIPATVNTRNFTPAFYDMKLEANRTSYFVQAISRALKKVPACNSSFIRNRWTNRSRIVYFDEVCCTVSVDKIINEQHFPVGCVIKNSDQLSIKEIYEKILHVKNTPVEELPELVGFIKFLKLPRFIRKFIMREIICNEELFKKKLGTFNLSELGMIEGVVGGAMPSPRLVVDFVPLKETKEIGLGFNFNHAIVDGYHIAKLNSEIVNTFKKADFF